jgi:HTH-type transcriptional regulator/antitoxin HigA
VTVATDEFMPRWASPPGGTVQDVLHERRMSTADLARIADISPRTVDDLIDGRLEITRDVAQALANHVGSTVEFWLAREAQYREDLRRVEADVWATELPVRKMVELGWIPRPSSWKDRLNICLRFFGISSVRDWASISQPIMQTAYFRVSSTTASDPDTVMAWLRQGELVTSEMPVAAWVPKVFRAQMPTLRSLTREKDPARFLPRLTEICAQSGVRVAVVRAPHGCPVSGVARFISGTPTIILSARHLAEDHFWFTFFHEAGHLLLHDPSEIFIDDEEQFAGEMKGGVEDEANHFAMQVLTPEPHGVQRSRWLSHRDVIRRAHELGISPGVLVGQLQHDGTLSFDTLNGLKRRYKWNGTSLEKA